MVFTVINLKNNLQLDKKYVIVFQIIMIALRFFFLEKINYPGETILGGLSFHTSESCQSQKANFQKSFIFLSIMILKQL